MTIEPHLTGIPALDELGLRLDAATRRRRSPFPRLRRRSTLAALGLLALVGTPALAVGGVSLSGGLFGHRGVLEALPQVAAVVEPEDPVATGRALARLGFAVEWRLVSDNPNRALPGESPTLERIVASPPTNTEILALLNTDGENTAAPDARSLRIEISPSGSEILSGHR